MVFAAPSHTVLLFSSSINIIIVRHGDRMTRVVLINSCAISSGPPRRQFGENIEKMEFECK